jgi:hypothetical protein
VGGKAERLFAQKRREQAGLTPPPPLLPRKKNENRRALGELNVNGVLTRAQAAAAQKVRERRGREKRRGRESRTRNETWSGEPSKPNVRLLL